MSGSALPYKRSAPSWLKVTPTEVTEMITKMAKKGMTPSQIGVALRDNHGIAQVSTVTNSKVLRILRGQGLAPGIPEDLYCLIKKAVSVRKHLERNRKDMDSKFRLDSHRISHSPLGAILQARQEARAVVQVRLGERRDALDDVNLAHRGRGNGGREDVLGCKDHPSLSHYIFRVIVLDARALGVRTAVGAQSKS